MQHRLPDSITDPECADVLLLALTPAAYSSNNTADTPGRRAFISPAQVGQEARFNARLAVVVTGCAVSAAMDKRKASSHQTHG
jgi:hypothetical protein